MTFTSSGSYKDEGGVSYQNSNALDAWTDTCTWPTGNTQVALAGTGYGGVGKADKFWQADMGVTIQVVSVDYKAVSSHPQHASGTFVKVCADADGQDCKTCGGKLSPDPVTTTQCNVEGRYIRLEGGGTQHRMGTATGTSAVCESTVAMQVPLPQQPLTMAPHTQVTRTLLFL